MHQNEEELRKREQEAPVPPVAPSLAIKLKIFVPPEIEVLMPGMTLTAIIAAIALHTGAQLHYVTPLIAAMAMGIVLRNAFIIPGSYLPGIFFSMRQVLRFAVVLLGVRITFSKITGLGWEGLAIALLPLLITYFLTIWFAKLLGEDSSRGSLIATGTSICGASAILTAGATTDAKEDNVIVAISTITIYGTIAMLAYPALYKMGVLNMTAEQYGFWAGASIHEVAQVVAAGFGGGDVAGEVSIIVKLTRVAALIPLAFILSYSTTMKKIKAGEDQSTLKGVAFPYFLFGFIAMVVLNSFEFFTPRAVRWIEFFDMFLLTMAMAGMGLETDFSKLTKVGYRPLLIGAFSTVIITASSFGLIRFLIK